MDSTSKKKPGTFRTSTTSNTRTDSAPGLSELEVHRDFFLVRELNRLHLLIDALHEGRRERVVSGGIRRLFHEAAVLVFRRELPGSDEERIVDPLLVVTLLD